MTTTPKEFIDALREASIKRRYLEEQLHSIELELASLSTTVEEHVWKAFPTVKGKEVNVVPIKDAEILHKLKSSVKAISHLLRDPTFYTDYERKAVTHPRIYAHLALYHMDRGEKAQAKLYIDKLDHSDPCNRAVFSEFHNIQVIPTSERDFISFCDQVYGGICPITMCEDDEKFCLE